MASDKPVRVVVEIDRNGLVDIASDAPVQVLILNHKYFNEETIEDGEIPMSLLNQQVLLSGQPQADVVDADYVQQVWDRARETIAPQVTNDNKQGFMDRFGPEIIEQ